MTRSPNLGFAVSGQLPTPGPENHKLALSAERKDNAALGATPSAPEAVGVNSVCQCTDQSPGVHHPEVANPGREQEAVHKSIGPPITSPPRRGPCAASVAEQGRNGICTIPMRGVDLPSSRLVPTIPQAETDWAFACAPQQG
jgi:hypothetical protein